jgi:dolichol-phosphate mannosyltransferase
MPEASDTPPGGPARPVLTVVVPVFNETDNVQPMHQALADAAASEPGIDWEFLFVEDGSTDETFAKLFALSQLDARVKVVRLSRNFGSHVGAAAGLDYANGDAAVIMAGDMQDHPREIPRMIAKWREGYHVVLANRATRQDSWATKFMARMFARVIRRIALPAYPLNGTGSFCLLDRKVINVLNAFPERNRMTFGLILSAGFSVTQIEYDRLSRHSGVSKWSFRQKVRHLANTVLSFSSWPIRMASLTGFAIAALSFVYALYLVASILIFGSQVEGWASIVVLLLLLSGIQLAVLGMLGEYIWRIADEVRQRPLFIVRDLVGDFPRVEARLAERASPSDVIRSQLIDDRNRPPRR